MAKNKDECILLANFQEPSGKTWTNNPKISSQSGGR